MMSLIILWKLICYANTLIGAVLNVKQDNEDTEDADLSFGGSGSSSGSNNPTANPSMAAFGTTRRLAGALTANQKMKICKDGCCYS